MNQPLNDLRDWIGRSESAHDTLHPTPLLALRATLDHPAQPAGAGAVLPPLWHWLYFLPLHRRSQIGADGHALRGGFLPPVPLPRRMWAGSQLEFHAPLRIGQRVARTSTLQNVTLKDGRNGPLVFVKVRHELRCNDAPQPALVEWHDIVYREMRRADETPAPAQPAPQGGAWMRELVPDEVLLFRYSALTFNAHRIHYDRRYVTAVEGYPGLVVHGPLIATLLLDLLHREMPAAEVATFRFKALRPSFDGQPLRVHGLPEPGGKSVRLWAADHEGWLTMDASVTLR